MRHKAGPAQMPVQRATVSASFRGNKAALPSKPCQACGRPMSWRRHWAKNWDAVKYCCELCRRAGPSHG